jgi:hypothetical protein
MFMVATGNYTKHCLEELGVKALHFEINNKKSRRIKNPANSISQILELVIYANTRCEIFRVKTSWSKRDILCHTIVGI